MDDAEVIELAQGKVKPKPSPHLDEELGQSGMPITTWLDFSGEDTSRIATSNATVPLDKLVEMRKKDGQARALMRLLSLPVRAALKEAEWVEPKEGDAQKETEFANQMFDLPPSLGGMTVTKQKFMRQVLLALVEGFAVFEEVRQIPTEGPLKGKITLRKIAHRDSRTIRFRVDEKGGFDGVKQIALVDQRTHEVVIPKEKVWWWACNEEENPFYGVSFFEAAYHHYELKRKLYYISHLAAQSAAMPGRVGRIPKSPDTKKLQAFKKALQDFAFNLAMTAPEGYEVEFANQNTGFNFLALIDHHNMQMSKSVLAKFLDDEQRQVLIDNAKGDPSADFFVMGLEAMMDEIAESLTHYLMPKYIDWNFGSGKYPVFKFGVLSDSSKEAIKDLFTVVATAQSSMWTPEFIREMEVKLTERFGFDIDYQAIAEREAEEKELALQQQQMYEQSQMQQEGGEPFPSEAGAEETEPFPEA